MTDTMRFPEDVPVLTDGVVTIRAHHLDDVDGMTQMCTDPEMQRWTAVPEDYTREHAIGFATDVMRRGWEEMNHRGWAIEAVDDQGEARFAGNVDVRGVPIADIGFALHPWARGRGLMTRAIRLAIEWSFAEGGVEIVHWRAHPGNADSLRVAWACGFELHGTTPGLLHERGRVLDAWTGSLRFGSDGRPRTTWRDVPVLEGDRVRLRPFEDRDAQRILEACNDETTRHWMPSLPAPYTLQTARDFVRSRRWQQATGDGATWCVADRDSDELLADICVMHAAGPGANGEIGYWAHPVSRGRGLVTEALRLVTSHALAPRDARGMGLRRLELFAAAGNAPSNAIARATGFTHVGTRRRAELLGDGSYDDLQAYDLLG